MTIDNMYMEAGKLLNQVRMLESVVRRLLPEEQNEQLKSITAEHNLFDYCVTVQVKMQVCIDGVIDNRVARLEVPEYTASYNVSAIVQRCLKVIMTMSNK